MRRRSITALTALIVLSVASSLAASRGEAETTTAAPFVRVRNETAERWIPVDTDGPRIGLDPVESGRAIPLARLTPLRYRCEPSGVQLDLSAPADQPGILLLKIVEAGETPLAREQRIALSTNAPNVLTLSEGFVASIRPGIPTAIEPSAREVDAGATIDVEISVNASDTPIALTLRAEPEGIVDMPAEIIARAGVARLALTAKELSIDRRVSISASAGGSEKSFDLVVRGRR